MTDEEALRKIFEEMEFRSLMERVFNREKKITTTENTIKKPTGQPDLFNGQLSLFGDTPTPSTTSKGQKQGNLFAEFADEGQGDSKYSNLANLESLPYNYQLIDNEDKRNELRTKLITSEILSLDTETTSTDPINAELVGMSFSIQENEAYYVPIPATTTKDPHTATRSYMIQLKIPHAMPQQNLTCCK